MTATDRHTTIAALRSNYDGFLLDAYGVLLDKHRAMPGAIALIDGLTRDDYPWLVVTNSASRLPETLSTEFADLGLRVPPERILTSGALLADRQLTGDLSGMTAVVLGPAESVTYAARAGVTVLPLSDDVDADALIVADQKAVRWPEHMNQALSMMIRRLDADRPLRLMLCNPDLIYPVSSGRFGFTAGGLATMLEAVLHERWPHAGLHFQRLGKPNPAIFEAATRRLGVRRPIMIGDQLGTDIAGAAAAAIDSALVGTGLAPAAAAAIGGITPTWMLPKLL